MRCLGIALLTALLFPAAASAADTPELYVVCNVAVTLAGDEIRDVFLGEKNFAGSLKLDPVDNSVAQAEFLRRVLAMDRAKYVRLWIKKSFRDGINPPQMLAGDAAVLAYVRSSRGGCGYFTARPGPTVTVVARF